MVYTGWYNLNHCNLLIINHGVVSIKFCAFLIWFTTRLRCHVNLSRFTLEKRGKHICCSLVLSSVQLSVIVDSYFVNFIQGFLVWLTTMVSIIFTIADTIEKWNGSNISNHRHFRKEIYTNVSRVFCRQSKCLAITHQVNRFGTQRGESCPA